MIMCSIDECTVAGLRGWAIDQDGDGRPIVLRVLIDGDERAVLPCTARRDDVASAGFRSAGVGFSWPMPNDLVDAKPHTLELRCDAGRMTTLHQGAFVESIRFVLEHPLRLHSWVDGLSRGELSGWVVAARGDGPLVGGHDLLVMCGEQAIGQVRADRYRGDVGRTLACDPNCGFRFVPPRSHRTARARRFGFLLLPDRLELENSPYTTSFVSDQQEAAALDVVDRIDRMHADLTRLRRRVRDLLPEPGDTLADYDAWTRRYFPVLRTRVEQARAPDRTSPLVSIVMPVHRPVLAHLVAAIASVRAQTHATWELIVVDDAGGDPAIAASLGDAAAADARIRVLTRETNGGISIATNDAIAAARGAWVAFLDHDDLLTDVAIEHMVAEADATGATLLYSDEDKIDPAGTLVDPAFKPDWNYRLLLGVNYVCHLVMVDRAVLAAAGPLASAKDGAQDHDLILRLAEIVPASRIHHVPEILYHWRMSETSTAISIGNKAYAVQAGIDAIAEHLERRGLPAVVSSRDEMTLYTVDWRFSVEPAVTIIVPYKDEAETTRLCVEHLLGATDYGNYEILLVDNWSTTREAQSLAASFAGAGRIRGMEIRERFNHSRLNNLAAAESRAAFLLFLNNDVVVSRPDWLRHAVAELLADPGAAVVGGKLFYPNGTIQHAGVALGIDGVAGHLHVGVAASEGGYGGRAFFAQEMSAVTAACMLVRAEAFREVGGFDEAELAVAFNDVDLCLRLRERGWRILWTPGFVAEHHESLSRGSDDRPSAEGRFFHETQVMIERHGTRLRRDPFYSPHFALDREPFFDLVRPGENADRYKPRRRPPPGAAEPAAAPAAPAARPPQSPSTQSPARSPRAKRRQLAT